MGKKPMKIKFGDIPPGKTFDDYPEDTLFMLDDHEPASEDSYWEDEDSTGQ